MIVSGDDALTEAIAGELEGAGATVVRLKDTRVGDTDVDLAEAGITQAPRGGVPDAH